MNDDPTTKYFRNTNVGDPSFESKKRKIFKAMYEIKKELKKKRDKNAAAASISSVSKTDSIEGLRYNSLESKKGE